MMDGESSPEREHHPDVNGVTDKTCGGGDGGGADDDRDVENEEGLTADSALMTVSSTLMKYNLFVSSGTPLCTSRQTPPIFPTNLFPVTSSFISLLQSSSTHLLLKSLSTYFFRQTLFGNLLSSHSSERFIKLNQDYVIQ